MVKALCSQFVLVTYSMKAGTVSDRLVLTDG